MTRRKWASVAAVLAVGMAGWLYAAGEGKKLAELPRPVVELPTSPNDTRAEIVLAGGCFWCTEVVFEQLKGVIEVESGYAGGTKQTAKYELVSAGQTDHAEVIRVVYDPRQVGYAELIRVLMTVIDPTTVDGQHPDYGRQYRSAVFVPDAERRRVAEAYVKQVAEAKVFEKPIALKVEDLGAGFFPAEAYHQDFVRHNPDHPYVRAWAYAKIDKVRKAFPDLVK